MTVTALRASMAGSPLEVRGVVGEAFRLSVLLRLGVLPYAKQAVEFLLINGKGAFLYADDLACKRHDATTGIEGRAHAVFVADEPGEMRIICNWLRDHGVNVTFTLKVADANGA